MVFPHGFLSGESCDCSRVLCDSLDTWSLDVMAIARKESLATELLDLLTQHPEDTTEASNLVLNLRAFMELRVRHRGQTAVVKDLAGETLAQISPIPATVAQLKQVAMDQSGIPVNLQKIIRDGCVLEDCEDVPLDALDLTLLLDETPLYQWDIRGNPDWSQLCVEGSSVQCPELRSDFVNVMTQEPLSKGVHYIQFVMHHIGDEQWCGVVIDKSQAGSACSGRSLRAWSYYCGRQGTCWCESHSATGGRLEVASLPLLVAQFTQF